MATNPENPADCINYQEAGGCNDCPELRAMLIVHPSTNTLEVLSFFCISPDGDSVSLEVGKNVTAATLSFNLK